MEQLSWAGTPMKFQRLKVRACLIWPHASYTPLHHVHIKQETDSKENWKLSGKVQETDGTEVYAAHSLASKFNSKQGWWTRSSHHSHQEYTWCYCM